MINGVPVVAAPADIDLTTANQLRMALLDAAGRGHGMVVVDMTSTRFCDSAGLSVLVRAYRRALDEGGELRVVMPADSTVCRIFSLTGLYNLIPRFDTVKEALTQPPATMIRPWRLGPSPWLRRASDQPSSSQPGA